MAKRERLQQIFPRASESFLQINSQPELQHPQSKPDLSNALGRAPKRKRTSNERIVLRLISRCVRPQDIDNRFGGAKALVDCIRTLQLIPNDDPGSIILQVEQEKVGSRAKEGTIVEILYP